MTVTTPGGPAQPGATEPDLTTYPDVTGFDWADDPVDGNGHGDSHGAGTPARMPGGMGTEPPWWQRPIGPVTPRHIGVAVGAWLAVSLVAVVLVLYGVGPMLEQRDQRGLLRQYRTDIRQAANEEVSLQVGGPETEAPDVGDPVGIVDIGALHFEQVVVEGVGPQQTRRGPGHVPGTGGLGQPGNSAVVARRSAFGGLFGEITKLRRGTEILVTTTQGQSVYEVVTVRRAQLRDDEEMETSYTDATSTTSTTEPADESEAGDSSTTTTEPEGPVLPRGRTLSTEDVYGPSEDDRLTLVTSASSTPWATGDAVVVVARLQGRPPFEPTPQNGRTEDDDGRSSDGGAGGPMLLAALAYLIAIAAAVLLYRRARPRSAYLLTAPPLLAGVVLMAESAARLLPAWF